MPEVWNRRKIRSRFVDLDQPPRSLYDFGILSDDFDQIEETEKIFVREIRRCGTLVPADLWTPDSDDNHFEIKDKRPNHPSYEIVRGNELREQELGWGWSLARQEEARVQAIKIKEAAEHNARCARERAEYLALIRLEGPQRERQRARARARARAQKREFETRKRERRLEKANAPLMQVLEDELVGSYCVHINGGSFKGTRLEYELKTERFVLFYNRFGCEGQKVLSGLIMDLARKRLNDIKNSEAPIG